MPDSADVLLLILVEMLLILGLLMLRLLGESMAGSMTRGLREAIAMGWVRAMPVEFDMAQ